MLVDGQVHVCNSFVFLDRGWRENRPPHLKGNISSPIKFINYAMFLENKTEKCFSTFHHQKIPRRNSICSVTVWPFMSSKNCLFVCFFLQENTSRKFLIFLLSYLPVFTANIVCICYHFALSPPTLSAMLPLKVLNQQQEIRDFYFFFSCLSNRDLYFPHTKYLM